MTPENVRHVFLFSFDLTTAAIDNRRVFKCRYCDVWTDNPETGISVMQVCSQRDRRHSQRRKSSTGGRRDTDKNLRLQACALASVENGISRNTEDDSGNRKETSVGTAVLPVM
jgi:hypothetical protein